MTDRETSSKNTPDIEALFAAAQAEQERAEVNGTEPGATGHNSSEFNTDLGNARRLVRRHGADMRYVHQFKSWFIWKGGYWQRDEDGGIMRLAEDTIEAIFTEALGVADDSRRSEMRKFALKSQARSQLENMVALAKNQAEVVLSADAFDADPMLLGVLNGVIDLQTGALRKGRREDYITKRCNVIFDASAQCPNWIRFQDKIAGGDKELIAYKQRLFGLLLTGRVSETLFILHGLGSNGKSTEAETIHELLADYALAVDASLLMTTKNQNGPTPEIVALKGKRAAFINETQENDHLNESRVKYLTSNDTIYARDMYEKPINFRPTHKPVLRTNHKPKIRGTDLGMWRRIHYVPYLVTIGEDEKDEGFREKMLLPELAGILNWVLEGLREYLRIGLKPPPVVCKGVAEYKKEMDTIGQWIELAVERIADGGKMSLADLHSHYEAWMWREMGWKGASRKKLAQELRERGFESDRDGGGNTEFKGLRLRWEHSCIPF